MGTVINLRFPEVVRDRAQRSPSPRRRGLRWSPAEAARAWWEMTLIKSTLETMCELAQHALREGEVRGDRMDPELQSAFTELRSAAEQVGEVCHEEVHGLLQGRVEALSFSLGTTDPHHIKVRSLPPEIAVIHPVFRDATLRSRETALVALRLIEQALQRFGDAIDCLSTTIGADGVAHSARKEKQLAAETAALTRLQILQQSDEALRSQAGVFPSRVYGLLNHSEDTTGVSSCPQ